MIGPNFRKKWLLTVPFLLLATVVVAAESQLEDDIALAAKAIADEVKRDNYQFMLIALRPGMGSKTDPESSKILGTVRDQLTRALQQENLTVVSSAKVDKLIARLPRTTRLKPDDVSQFRKMEEIEVALIIEYRKRGRQRRLNLELLDNLESIWKETIRLPNVGQQTRRSSRSTQAKNSQAGNPRTTQAGTATSCNRNNSRNSRPNSRTAGQNQPPRRNRPAGLPPTASQQQASSGGTGPRTSLPNLNNVANTNQATSLNLRVLQFAISQFGKQVGNGECWTLADQALRAAGAQPARGYTYGNRIPLNSIGPGDILQFTSVRIETGNMYYLFGLPNHTAVVHSVSGNTVRILHQNFGKKIVTAFEFDIKGITKGMIEAFRPVPN